MKLLEKTHTIKLPVFGYNIYFVITNNIEASRLKRNNILGRINLPLSKYIDGLHSYNKFDFDSYIFVTPESTIGTVAHEIFHSLWRMFKYFGVKIDDETFAYHLTYLLDEFVKFKNKSIHLRKK